MFQDSAAVETIEHHSLSRDALAFRTLSNLTQERVGLTDASARRPFVHKDGARTRLSAPDCTLNELANSSDLTWLVIKWYISDAMARTNDVCKAPARTK